MTGNIIFSAQPTADVPSMELPRPRDALVDSFNVIFIRSLHDLSNAEWAIADGWYRNISRGATRPGLNPKRPAVGTFGLGVMLLSALNNSGNTNSVRPLTNLSHGSTAGKLNFYMRTDASVYNAADGPNDAFSSGVIITAIDMNDDQLTRLSIPGSSQLKQSYDESTAAAAFAATTDTFLFMAFDNGGSEALDLEITEAHILKI